MHGIGNGTQHIYVTHGIGKWHLGFFEKEYTPTYRGFDSFYGFWNGKEDYWDHSSQEDVWGTDLRDNEKPVRNESGHYGTELFAERAAQIIHLHNQTKPLYLYLAQQGVHSANGNEPLQAPKRLIKKFSHISSPKRRIYAAMVSSLDESVETVHKALSETGMLNNTVLVFTTDNGGAPRGFNWNQGSNYPFKGGKDTFWEGGVRGVGFVYSDLIKHKQRVSHDLIDVTDWLPTFYQLGGGDTEQLERVIDGVSVWDTISEGNPSPRTEVLHNVDPIRKFAAIRVKNYKLIFNQDAVHKTEWFPRYEQTSEPKMDDLSERLPGAVIECGKWNHKTGKECVTDEFPCLFDLDSDPCEYNNIAEDNLPIVRRLLKRLTKHQKKARPVWFPERDPEANPANLDGFWGPWKENPSNQDILRDAVEKASHFLKDNSFGRCLNSTDREGVYRGDGDIEKLLCKVLKQSKLGDIGKSKKEHIAKDDKQQIYRNIQKLYRGMSRKTHNKNLDGTKKGKHIHEIRRVRREVQRPKRWESDERSRNPHGQEAASARRMVSHADEGGTVPGTTGLRLDSIDSRASSQTGAAVRRILKQNIIRKHDQDLNQRSKRQKRIADDYDYDYDFALGYGLGMLGDTLPENAKSDDVTKRDSIPETKSQLYKKSKTAKARGKGKFKSSKRSEIPNVKKDDILSALDRLFRE
ncbi:arylsulfatase B isoform X2 [Nematostella vectensis]|uniref:arylsulfatase B isoform X2 n=1 Tax=Nematostella vectensis TaxID=45351 RepID=UPI0020773628|nr:arylsulfatase B isoform X2 [Nematostella vectensis]